MDDETQDLIDALSPAISGNAFVVAERMQALPPRSARLLPPSLREAVEALSRRTIGSAEGMIGLRRDAEALRMLVCAAERALFPIKICGLSTPETMAAALDAGADMVGLVFHPKSPRFVTPARAKALASQARGRALVTALVVDMDDAGIDAVMEAAAPDLIQLHGTETPERCDAIATRTERPVMKAVGIAGPDDLAGARRYRPHADRLLLDAKPPKDAAYPGGHGRPFDWTLLKGLDPFMPFILSGGLTPETVGEAIGAIRDLGVTLAGVDVSSGVESAPGVKDPAKIRAFIENARNAIPSPRERGEG